MAQPAAHVSVVAGGDVMLDRGVRTQVRKYGARALFSGIEPILQGADIAFANLECPLARHAPRASRAPGHPAFRADPALAFSLRRAGFGVLSLANNHALDCGSAGLQETLSALRTAQLGAIGLASQEHHPFVTRLRGLRIAWVAASAFGSETGASPAITLLREASLASQVRAAKSRADVVMVSLHWGIEYRATPTPAQKALARALWSAGADVILGHHSHVLGPIEEARLGGRRRLVAYSLGNLVFDPPRWEPRARQSALLRLVLSQGGLVSWRKIPLRIRDCRPEPLADPRAST